ncbi:MAG: YraN family protein [Planctomycetota bacterium]
MARLQGRWGEEAARRHALWRGATLVERNARDRQGELDLVLRHWAPPHWGVLVFAEVKARRAGLDEAQAAVTPEKQRRVMAAACRWLAARGLDPETTPIRFDVFAVGVDARGRPQVRWIQGAFPEAA